MEFEDTKGGVLDKKYKEFETCVLQKDVIDWKQVEEKLRQFLLEYDSTKSDELRFTIKSTTWRKVFWTHVGSIPVSVQKCLQLCEELEKAYIFRRIPLIDGYDPYIGRCERVGEYVLNMKTVDWDEIRKFLWEIIFDWRRELGFQGITVEDLDGEQHIIYNNMYHRYGNMDYLVSSVVDTTGLSKEDFVFVYGKSLIFPWENLYIPDGANIKLLPLKKELANQSIVVEDLDGQQHIINTNWVMYNDDVDYLVRQVARTTGISKRRFVLVYSEKLIVPGQYFYIPNGAKIQLLPVKKNQNPPTDLTTYVRGICNGIYGQIHRLLSNFPKAFEDTTRLLSEKDFVRISQLIGKGWGMLGIELGLTKVKLQQIKEDKQNAVSRIFEMLNQWGQTRKNGATAGQLLSAVMKSGVSCEFENLKRALLIGL
ncbi:uncharacterized protein LOC132738171 [Ruditapes philippinarum]|uniref:uncharacterized protein LOC132738171 n=1 Tax=Ruditapes philippinarum TaxID=129788 RepID=UPI00295C2D20|nr:uncharacterized protein LOC132738171 [Ruditapes philippinarum]